MRLPGSHSFTRSTMMNGYRCGRCARTALTSISAIFLSFAAKRRRGAGPRRMFVERIHPGIGTGLEKRPGDERAGGNVHMVDDAQVADDDRRAADGAVPADVG